MYKIPVAKTLAIDFDLHTWMIGQSGTGKSTVQTNVFIRQMQDGKGCGLIDPHGLSADKSLHYVPRWRMNDVILIDLSLAALPGIIPQYKTEKEKRLFKHGIVSMLRSMFKDRWGDETERIIKGALDAVTEYYGFINVPALYLFIARDKFRRKILKKCKNPILADFSEQYDEKLRPTEQMTKFSPPLNKIDMFVEPEMWTITSNEKPIDWLRAMNERKIIIARLPKGEIGEDIARFVGSIIVLNFKIAGLGRKDDDPSFYLSIDECQNFLGSVDFETFSSEMRKYKVWLFLVTQYLGNFSSLKAIFGSFSNGLIYRISGEDATTLEDNYIDPGLAHQLVTLEDYHFVCKYKENGIIHDSGVVESQEKANKLGDEPPRGAVIAESMRRYGADQKAIGIRTLKFLMPEPEDRTAEDELKRTKDELKVTKKELKKVTKDLDKANKKLDKALAKNKKS